MLQLHIVFVLFAAKAGCGTLTPTSDRLSVAVVGERVPFSCRIDGSTGNISWIYYRTGSKKEHTIHTGRKMNPAFEAMFTVNANRSSGASELIAHSVTSAESGMYLCSETHTAVTRVDFELVVIESTPKCQLDVRQRRFPASVDTDDQLRVNCSVPYSGNVAPSFRCDPQFRGEQVSNDADVSTHVVSYSKRVNALMMNATTHLTCRAMLNSTMRDGRAAIKYFYSWNSTDVFGSTATVQATRSSGPATAVGGTC